MTTSQAPDDTGTLARTAPTHLPNQLNNHAHRRLGVRAHRLLDVAAIAKLHANILIVPFPDFDLSTRFPSCPCAPGQRPQKRAEPSFWFLVVGIAPFCRRGLGGPQELIDLYKVRAMAALDEP